MSVSSPIPRPTGSEMPDTGEGKSSQHADASTTRAEEVASPRRRSTRSRRLAISASKEGLTGTQRLLLLDTWRRSGLPSGDFAPLVGVSKHTLYAWKHRFEAEGPAGLEEKPRGAPTGSRLPEVTKRTGGCHRGQRHGDHSSDQVRRDQFAGRES